MNKNETIQEINDFLEDKTDYFAKDALDFVIYKTKNLLNKHVEADFSSRAAALELINTLLLELPENSVKSISLGLIVGFAMYWNSGKGR